MPEVVNIGVAFDSQIDTRDGTGNIIRPLQGYPKVRMYDHTGQPLIETTAADDGDGKFTVTLTVPDIELQERKLFRIKWLIKTVDGSQYVEKQDLWVQPNQSVTMEDPVLLNTDERFEMYLPVVIDNAGTNRAEICIRLLHRNEEVFVFAADTHIDTSVFDVSTKLVVEMKGSIPPQIYPYGAIAEYRLGGRLQRMSFEIWSITPTMLASVDYMLRYLDKARLENRIEALAFSQGDMLKYLGAGLDMLNTYGPALWSFNGLCMTGVLQNMHVRCSLYMALLAQLKAEGDHSYDLSASAVSFTVNRTEALQSMLEEVKAYIDEKLPAQKHLLTRYGITGGDGSNTTPTHKQQAWINVARQPTTQIHHQNAVNINYLGTWH